MWIKQVLCKLEVETFQLLPVLKMLHATGCHLELTKNALLHMFFLLLKIYHISHQNENIEKEGNQSDEAMQREEGQRVVKKNVKIVWRICHQQRLGAYHYHHSVVVCCTI